MYPGTRAKVDSYTASLVLCVSVCVRICLHMCAFICRCMWQEHVIWERIIQGKRSLEYSPPYNIFFIIPPSLATVLSFTLMTSYLDPKPLINLVCNEWYSKGTGLARTLGLSLPAVGNCIHQLGLKWRYRGVCQAPTLFLHKLAFLPLLPVAAATSCIQGRKHFWQKNPDCNFRAAQADLRNAIHWLAKKENET